MYKNFIYNEEKGIVFAYAPKVACTNWKAIMRRLQGATDWLDNKLAHDRSKSGLIFLDLKPDKPNYGIPRNAKLLTMVRNPYERILSAYLNKVLSNSDNTSQFSSDDIWYKVIGDIENFRVSQLDSTKFPKVSFEVFLRWLKDSGSWLTKNEHWASQTTLLLQPQINFDFIGRFENLKKDSETILKLLNLDIDFPSQKDVNFSPTNSKTKLDKYLSPSTSELVLQIYQSDFEIFGYDIIT